jgi:hypothetical protein
MADGEGIHLGTLAALANCHDSPLLTPTLDALEALGVRPEPMSVYLDWGYDSNVARRLLENRSLESALSKERCLCASRNDETVGCRTNQLQTTTPITTPTRPETAHAHLRATTRNIRRDSA